MRLSWHRLGLLLTIALLVTGCSSKKGEPKFKVSGTVEMDGKPLPDGEITFMGEPGTIPASFTVSNGNFEGELTAGKKKVEVRSYKTEPAPKSATGGASESKVNIIPDRFNSNSALTAEVSESGMTPKKFVVASK
jgi:hypothetical protein